MALLDTASLIVTPNGYKASKLYSIVPSDGSGDMTFSRTGDTATRVNSSGLIATVNANIPRLDYLGSTCPKLLMEPQRTNVILQSQDISNASWTKTSSPTIVTNVAVSPDGTTTADSIQSEDASNFKYISQSFSVSANSTYTFSIFIKKETTTTNFGGFGFTFFGNSLKVCYMTFNEVTGSLTIISNAMTITSKVDDYGTYWRFNVTATDAFSNTTFKVEIYGTISTNGTSTGAGAGSARTIWGAQLETGAFATSYIPTTTASVTRNVDDAIKTSATALIGQTEGTMFYDVNLDSRIGNCSFTLYTSAGGTLIRILIANTYIAAEIYNSSIQTGNVLVNNTSTGRLKLAISYSNDFLNLYINGTLGGTDTSTAIPACERFNIGLSNTNGIKINSAALWKTRLTNSELAQLTTL